MPMRRILVTGSGGFVGRHLLPVLQAAFPEAICWRDQMPEKGEVDLTNYLPFLALTS